MRRYPSFVKYFSAALNTAAVSHSRRRAQKTSPSGFCLRVAAVMMFALASSLVSAQTITGPGNRIPWEGQNLYLAGNNVPWYNYATDFGTGNWGKFTNFNNINGLFASMSKQKAKAARWWLFGDGRYSPEFNGSGMVTGLDSQFFTDIDTALRIAHDNHIYLIPCLVDFLMFQGTQSSGGVTGGGHSALVTNPAAMQSYLDNALKPLLQHVAASPFKNSILAYDIANEPEFATSGIAGGSASLPQMQNFIKSCASYIHKYGGGAYATMGSGADYWVRNWVGLGLDFYQVHWYPNFTGQGLSSYASLKLDKPCIVGEFPTKSWYQNIGSQTPNSSQWFLDTIYNQGYAGALGWSGFTVDNQGDWNAFAPVFTAWVANKDKTPNGSAAFVRLDTKTQGNWKGSYGSEGYNVLNETSGYATWTDVFASGHIPWTWADPTSETRTLQKVNSNTDRLAACIYCENQFSLDVNLSDDNSHQIALYCLDYDKRQRVETIDVLDGVSNKLLDTRTLSGYQNGSYLVWNIKGYVRFRFTNAGPYSAVVSGIFFDPQGRVGGAASNAASFVKADAGTSGSWKGKYGSQGYNVINHAVNYPSYASVTAGGQIIPYTWTSSTTNTPALQKTGTATDRIAACWCGSVYNLDINLTDGQTHQVALYCLDYDKGGRKETIDLLDGDTNAVLSTQNLSSYSNGIYLVWNIKGHVKLRMTNTGLYNALISGVFFDAASGSGSTTAAFVKTDTSTQGTWQGKYGAGGYNIINNVVNYPTYATVLTGGQTSYTWADSTTNTSALQKAGTATDRIAACWCGSVYNLDINLTDGQTHQVALYCLDYDNGGRSQTIDVVNADTNVVLSTQNVSSYAQGKYFVWNIKGHVRFRITNTGPFNALLSGLFFD